VVARYHTYTNIQIHVRIHFTPGVVQTLQGETCEVVARYGAIVRANPPIVTQITHTFPDGSKYVGEAAPSERRAQVCACMYVCICMYAYVCVHMYVCMDGSNYVSEAAPSERRA
jgi:hypothetical protein